MLVFLCLVAVGFVAAASVDGRNRSSCFEYVDCLERAHYSLRTCAGGTALALALEAKDNGFSDIIRFRHSDLMTCQERLKKEIIDFDALQVLVNDDARECFEKLPESTGKNFDVYPEHCGAVPVRSLTPVMKESSQCLTEFKETREQCERLLECCPEHTRCAERMNAVSVAYQHGKAKSLQVVSNLLRCLVSLDPTIATQVSILQTHRDIYRNAGLPLIKPDRETEERITRRLSLTSHTSLEMRRLRFNRKYLQVRGLIAEKPIQQPVEIPTTTQLPSVRKAEIVRNLLKNAKDEEITSFVTLIAEGNFAKLATIEEERRNKETSPEKLDASIDKMEKIKDAIKAALANKEVKTAETAAQSEQPAPVVEEKKSEEPATKDEKIKETMVKAMENIDNDTLLRAKKFASQVEAKIEDKKVELARQEAIFHGSGLPVMSTAEAVSTSQMVHEFAHKLRSKEESEEVMLPEAGVETTSVSTDEKAKIEEGLDSIDSREELVRTENNERLMKVEFQTQEDKKVESAVVSNDDVVTTAALVTEAQVAESTTEKPAEVATEEPVKIETVTEPAKEERKPMDGEVKKAKKSKKSKSAAKKKAEAEVKKAEEEVKKAPEEPAAAVETTPKVEEPVVVEAIVTEAPSTETPATEAPATEAPSTEAPSTESPATEAPSTEAPVTEAPTEAPTTELVTEEPTTAAAVEATTAKKHKKRRHHKKTEGEVTTPRPIEIVATKESTVDEEIKKIEEQIDYIKDRKAPEHFKRENNDIIEEAEGALVTREEIALAAKEVRQELVTAPTPVDDIPKPEELKPEHLMADLVTDLASRLGKSAKPTTAAPETTTEAAATTESFLEAEPLTSVATSEPIVEGSGEETVATEVATEAATTEQTTEASTAAVTLAAVAETSAPVVSRDVPVVRHCQVYARCQETVKDYEDQCDLRYSKDILSHGIDDAEILAILKNSSISQHEIVLKACLRPIDKAVHATLKQLVIIQRGVRKACLDLGRNRVNVTAEQLVQCHEALPSTEELDNFFSTVHHRSEENQLTCRAKLATYREACDNVRQCCGSVKTCDKYIATSPVQTMKDEAVSRLVKRQNECEQRMIDTLKYIHAQLTPEEIFRRRMLRVRRV